VPGVGDVGGALGHGGGESVAEGQRGQGGDIAKTGWSREG
jgi:hypothetical protein